MSLEGIQLGRYQLYQMLGSGGMGEVYLAEDSGLGRQVAIKVVRSEPYYTFDLESVVRTERLFEREMKVISQLDHPHILPLFDYGETRANGTTITYMVMPYRPEGSFSAWLHQRRHNGPLPLQDVTNFIGQAASALQHAHEHQVIHQDVKPSNFLMRMRPEEPDHPDLLLMDFGISRISTGTASTSQFVEGTPAYMAPEQWKGHPTYASDQYALAVMAYELFTGRPPFSGRAEAVMYKHINEMPAALGSINPALPSAIDAVLMRALAKQPEERFPSIATFAHALQQACTDEEATIIRTRPGDSIGHSTLSLLANEQVEAEQGNVLTRRRISAGEAEYAANRSATPLPVAMAPTPIFSTPPPVIEQGEVTQQMGQPMAEARGLNTTSGPYEAGMFAAPATLPQRISTMSKTLRIGLIITLVWAVGGLFYYFAFARTTPHTSSYSSAAITSPQAGNTVPTGQNNSTGTHQTSTHTTTTAQAQTGNTPIVQTQTGDTNFGIQATTQAQTAANANVQATAQAQQQANAQATANANATAAVVAMAAPMYRLVSATTGDHFYTMSAAERNNAVAAYGYRNEGIAYYTFSGPVANSVPLYRLVSTTTGHHFYTTSASERDKAVAAYGYRYEGIACYVFSSAVPKSVPLYRLYNSKNNDHLYTTSAAESKNAVAVFGYTYEEIACYVLTS
jgi:serine/threonine protein kinase/ribosomal protein L33